jgi:hypothetical protein
LPPSSSPSAPSSSGAFPLSPLSLSNANFYFNLFLFQVLRTLFRLPPPAMRLAQTSNCHHSRTNSTNCPCSAIRIPVLVEGPAAGDSSPPFEEVIAHKSK